MVWKIAKWLDDPAGRHGRQIATRLVIYMLILLGVAFAFTGAGTLIALHRTDANKKDLQHRSEKRDKERDALIERINALTTKLADDRVHDKKVLCTAVATALAQNPGTPSPVLTQFRVNYGCAKL